MWQEETYLASNFTIPEGTKFAEHVNINSVGTFGMTECFLVKKRDRDCVKVIMDF